MGFAKDHPAVKALLNSRKALTHEMETLKKDKATYEESIGVRGLLQRHIRELDLRLGEWGWKVNGNTLVRAACPDGLDTSSSRRKAGTYKR